MSVSESPYEYNFIYLNKTEQLLLASYTFELASIIVIKLCLFIEIKFSALSTHRNDTLILL